MTISIGCKYLQPQHKYPATIYTGSSGGGGRTRRHIVLEAGGGVSVKTENEEKRGRGNKKFGDADSV
jgi:hypothetical protein